MLPTAAAAAAHHHHSAAAVDAVDAAGTCTARTPVAVEVALQGPDEIGHVQVPVPQILVLDFLSRFAREEQL